MAKNGFRIIDADCHVFEPPDIISTNIDKQYRDVLPNYLPEGASTYQTTRMHYGRRMGDHDASIQQSAKLYAHSKPRFREKPHPETSRNPDARITDMDREGIDVNVLIPTGITSFCIADDVALEGAIYTAYHRYMRDFCAAYPDRLRGVMVACGRSPDLALREIERVAKEGWCVAVFPSLPPGMPFDDPDLDPIWRAAAEADFTIALHTFTALAPFAPGALDNSYFNNGWLARSAAHPWCGMRNMASLLGGGAMDRFPDLRVAVLEAGHGWLPYWVGRLDEQAAYVSSAVSESYRSIREWIDSGRYFQSIELHEGAVATKYVIDTLGSEVLMFGTDYPHGESWFPDSVDTFLTWSEIQAADKAKLLRANAVRCFPRIP